MNGKRIVLLIVLAAFVSMTGLVLREHGYLGFFQLMQANSATELSMFDLVISLTLIALWMVRDARQRGRSALPYLLVTLAFGSAGPLLYLLLLPEREARVA